MNISLTESLLKKETFKMCLCIAIEILCKEKLQLSLKKKIQIQIYALKCKHKRPLSPSYSCCFGLLVPAEQIALFINTNGLCLLTAEDKENCGTRRLWLCYVHVVLHLQSANLFAWSIQYIKTTLTLKKYVLT